MAKQTFTTGQVLLASQLTSLQQTAMLGGAASAKTASYTLVAADAGTAISMTSTSATTITVNTGLFAAGDTVQITNLGSGVSTITAGTATVNTSASLALAQYESGTLDFTSTSAAIFIKGAGAAASGGGMTLLSTTTLSGASTTVSSISGDYEDLYINIFEMTNATALSNIALTLFNGATGITNITGYRTDTKPAPIVQDVISTLPLSAFLGNSSKINRTTASNFYNIRIMNYAASSEFKVLRIHGGYQADDLNYNLYTIDAYIYSDTAIDKIVLSSPGGNFNAGTIQIYGVK